ncbi:MAG: bacillithiol biosynthesis deacetylase BshB1 [Cyclobacteriaceae bacterium]|nr:MAG: bacillithiol biosynthesis deacetylase BshB1 [Cyclobacteriaceae bacterium]
MKLDILVIAAHPDDAELGCGGTLAKHISRGFKAGIIDLTRGELGTRGTPEIRASEAALAANILGLSVRENLELPDAFFMNDKETRLKVVQVIRKYRPDIVITNAVEDRHPDHGQAARLVNDACFLAGLSKIQTNLHGNAQQPWRPRALYHFIQARYIQPDVIVDISDYWEKKEASFMAYASQMYNPQSAEPATYIASREFLDLVRARAVEFGNAIGKKYGEGFVVNRTIGVSLLTDLL